MPLMENLEKNILLEINLVNNSQLDIKTSRSDIENWVPFTFLFEVLQDKYVYDEKAKATFTLYEIKKLVSEFKKIIHLKQNNQSFDTFKFFNLESNFGLNIYDPLEENEIGIDVWINMGTYTNGKIHGFNKGFSFEVSLESLFQFTTQLSLQLDGLTTQSSKS